MIWSHEEASTTIQGTNWFNIRIIQDTVNKKHRHEITLVYVQSM